MKLRLRPVKPAPGAKIWETHEKSSGITPSSPKEVAEKSREYDKIPADRGAHTLESTNEGSE